MANAGTIRTLVSIFAVLAGGALIWAGYRTSDLHIFPNIGFMMHLHGFLLAVAGAAVATIGIIIFLQKRPHA
jgi:hypothetical protein